MAKQNVTKSRTVSPARAKQLIEFYVRAQKPLYIHGQPGIGKSDMIRAIGKEMKREVFDVRLTLMTETDIRGIPHMKRNEEIVILQAVQDKDGNVIKPEEKKTLVKETMEWAPPSTFPLDPDSNAILFLDEISQAAPSVQAAALQLILDRSIGDFKLPAGVSIVAAGNRQSDRTGTKALITALRNRFAHITVESSFNDWQQWAIDNRVHPNVIGFLSQHKNLLNKFEDVMRDSPHENAFATPRSWTMFVSDLLKDPHMTDDLMMDVVAAGVGEATAIQFVALAKLVSNMPNVDDILSGKVKKVEMDKDNKMAISFSLATNLTFTVSEMHIQLSQETDPAVKEAKTLSWHKAVGNFITFINTNFDPEIGALAMSLCFKNYKLPFNRKLIPELSEWLKENSKFYAAVIGNAD